MTRHGDLVLSFCKITLDVTVIGTIYGHFTRDMASDSVVIENAISDHAIPEAVTNWPYCGDLGSVPGQFTHVGFVVDKMGLGQIFFLNTSFLIYHDHSISAPFISKLEVS